MRKLLCILMLLSLCFMLVAEQHFLGSLEQSQNYLPFHGSFEYGWSKSLYTQAELLSSGLVLGSEILALGVSVATTPLNYQMRSQKVYLRNSPVAYYSSSESLPNLQSYTKVFEGDFAIGAPGWLHISFEEAFIYNGGHLELVWLNQGGEATSTRPTFHDYSTPSYYRSVYKHANSSFPTGTGTLRYRSLSLKLISSTCPQPLEAGLIYPANGSRSFASTRLAWHNSGSVASVYDVFFGDQTPPPYLGRQSSNLLDLDVLSTGEYYWQIVPVNLSHNAADCPIWSFHVPAEGTLMESFESSTFPPLGWQADAAFSISAVYPIYHGTRAAFISAQSLPSRLITPKLRLDGSASLSLWARAGAASAAGRLRILISSDGLNWQQVGTVIEMPPNTAWFEIQRSLGELGLSSAYLAIEAFSSSGSASIYLDHVFAPPVLKAAPGEPQISCTNGFLNLNWLACEGATGYKLQYSQDPHAGLWEDLLTTTATSTSLEATPRRAFYRVLAIYP